MNFPSKRGLFPDFVFLYMVLSSLQLSRQEILGNLFTLEFNLSGSPASP